MHYLVADQHSGLAAEPPVLGHRQDGPPRPMRSLDPFKVSSFSFLLFHLLLHCFFGGLDLGFCQASQEIFTATDIELT